MDRAAWQAIAEERLLDAQALLLAQRSSAAYYLVGYAVEAGLKACILVNLATEPHVIFDRKTFSEKCWTHDIDELVKLANLEGTLDADKAVNPILKDNWDCVCNWSERSRYLLHGRDDAEKLYNAITDKANGVMPWIRVRW